jgi:hypothetical protein
MDTDDRQKYMMFFSAHSSASILVKERGENRRHLFHTLVVVQLGKEFLFCFCFLVD